MSTRNLIAFNAIIVTYVTWQGHKRHMMTAEKERTNSSLARQSNKLSDGPIHSRRIKIEKIEKN